MTSKYLRCRDEHPTVVKLQKLFDLADELGISFEIIEQSCVVYDSERDSNLPGLQLQDIETGDFGGVFPPPLEYKLIYDNPVYLKEQQDRLEEDRRLSKERAETLRLQFEQEKIANEKKKQLVIEAKERALLSELKLKYEK